jgi:glycerol-3-phosphate acyltransferase PlsX
MVRIAVDTAGGDHGPGTTVYGTCLAMQEDPELECLLFGEPKQIEDALPDFADADRMEIIAADEVITDDDDPLRAVRRKKESTIVKGLTAVAEGEADAFVSAGNSGAIFAGSLSIIGQTPEVTRPASVTVLPTTSESTPHYLIIDSGANIAAKPEHLAQYGRLGSKVAKQLLQAENPRVGLLNIGTESTKGNAFTKETFQLLSADEDLNFTGNVEPHTLLGGTHEVVLTDGFTGNIMLKAVEGTAGILMHDLMEKIKTNGNLGENDEKMIENLIYSYINRYTNQDIGGGFILGIKAPAIITHGSADEVMFKHSVEMGAGLSKSNIF